jgi:hypothetical protein
MTNQEMIEKLETAKVLMADVYGEVCYMDKKYYGRIEDWLSCADSCAIDAIEELSEFIEEGV